jgi:hypothetical protein
MRFDFRFIIYFMHPIPRTRFRRPEVDWQAVPLQPAPENRAPSLCGLSLPRDKNGIGRFSPELKRFSEAAEEDGRNASLLVSYQLKTRPSRTQ